MKQNAVSIRPFIGARNFNLSRNFYRDLGFEETVLAPNLSVFKMQNLAFYLLMNKIEKFFRNNWFMLACIPVS